MRDLPLWTRLGVKLTALVALVTLGTISWFTIASLDAQQRHLEAEVVRGAALFSDAIKSSTYHEMLADRREQAYRMMEVIGRQDGIEKVRMLNKEGRVTFSTQRREIGTYLDKRAESCYACHAAGKPLVRLAVKSRSRIFRSPDGHRTLGMVTPIYNEPACARAACHAHPEPQRVLGVVDIDISLADIDHDLAAARRRTALLAAVAVLVLATGVALLLHNSVVRPVGRLLEGTRRVAAGDLEHEIPVSPAGEMGLLAVSFNRMTGSLRRAQAEIRHLMDNLERQVEERTAALRETQGQLIHVEKMVSLGKLSASIAHEINNPLLGILTYAKLLGRTLGEGPPDAATLAACVRQLALVERETHRCSTIVRNLLDFARQRELTLADVAPNDAIEEALSLLAHQMALLGITLERRLGAVPRVRADFGQVRQALVNVILNACEAMPRGGTLTVTSRVASDGAAVELEIADTGVGIPPEHLSKVLDPFFTTKEKGTGLGLSVVYGIVERHGGKVVLRSEAGRGTAVTIRLPVRAAAEASG